MRVVPAFGRRLWRLTDIVADFIAGHLAQTLDHVRCPGPHSTFACATGTDSCGANIAGRGGGAAEENNPNVE